MSLVTDIAFVAALQSNTTLMAKLAAKKVYNTSIAVPDKDLINAPLPYIIVSFDGLQNDTSTKDCSYDAEEDKVQIGIEIAARSRRKLGELAQDVRDTVRSYFENYSAPSSEMEEDLTDIIPDDYTFSANGVQYDPDKPCYFQTLTYNCDTKNIYSNDEQE